MTECDCFCPTTDAEIKKLRADVLKLRTALQELVARRERAVRDSGLPSTFLAGSDDRYTRARAALEETK